MVQTNLGEWLPALTDAHRYIRRNATVTTMCHSPQFSKYQMVLLRYEKYTKWF